MRKTNNFVLRENRELNSPNFAANEWESCLEAGCYQYALDWKTNEFFLVGKLLGRECKQGVSTETLYVTLTKELEALNYEVNPVDVKVKTKKGEKKIYIQIFPSIGRYHILREDCDGKWSHKYPRELPTRLDVEGNIIENPELMKEKFSFYGWCFLLKNRMS